MVYFTIVYCGVFTIVYSGVFTIVSWILLLISSKCKILQHKFGNAGFVQNWFLRCQFKVYHNILILHPFISYLGVLTSLSIFSYSQTLSMETALVSISHAFLTQKLRDWVIWRWKTKSLMNEYQSFIYY